MGDDFARPPIIYKNGKNDFLGIASGYTESISKKLGIDFLPQKGLTWEQVLEGIKSHEIDILPAIVRTPEKEAYIAFTKPYITFPIIIVSRKDGLFIDNLKDLTDHRVGVVNGQTSQKSLGEDYPFIEVIPYTSVASGLEALADGKLEAFVGNLGVITFEMDRLRLDTLKITAPTSYNFELSMGVRKDWPKLVSILDKAIETITDKEQMSIKNTWMGITVEIGTSLSTILKWVTPILISIMIIIALIVLWNRRMAKEINERKIIEEKLKQLTFDLENAKEEAEAATKAKGDFLANMSHEIRTPMNAIIGLNHLLSRTKMSNKQKDYVNKVSNSATGLLGIINDILDFSKIEAGKMDIEKIDFELNDIFDNLLNLVSDKVEQKGLELKIITEKDVPPFVNGDPLRIGQIILNFVSNALKFTEKGEIRITCNLVSLEKDMAELRFSVSDTGLGLSDKQQKKLFNAFTQADFSTTRKYGGTGLGLSISKRLSELMGGSVGVEGELDVGSTFYFTIKCKVLDESVANIDKKDKEVSAELLNSIRGASILLIEDNEINQQVAVELLESEGLFVDVADNGKIACDKIEQKDYDLVFMDLQMPVLDGFEATGRIRKELNKQDLPIIAMTADAMTGVEGKVKNAGMNDYITKPINLEQLKLLVD